ncbi:MULTISPECIES: hypothetical protein [Spirulina sp. CCY15215]|uniref:hypothetical protein n=1 Tax=Spirulina sp. CCY15215 TaxID=2767591 RepID=UPI00194F4702|nr:hypothetical protein [Spirulina major]
MLQVGGEAIAFKERESLSSKISYNFPNVFKASMSELLDFINDSESLRAYRHRVRIFVRDLEGEKDPQKRAKFARYLAEAATTLARLEAAAAEG